MSKKIDKKAIAKEGGAVKKETGLQSYGVIRSPLITEKSTQGSEHNKVSFKVAKCATKKEIKDAVESLFKVDVTRVNTINVMGKTKLFKGRKGKRSDYKKAIVRIKEGQNIDVMAGVR